MQSGELVRFDGPPAGRCAAGATSPGRHRATASIRSPTAGCGSRPPVWPRSAKRSGSTAPPVEDAAAVADALATTAAGDGARSGCTAPASRRPGGRQPIEVARDPAIVGAGASAERTVSRTAGRIWCRIATRASAAPSRPRSPMRPGVGEHSREVLAEAGLTDGRDRRPGRAAGHHAGRAVRAEGADQLPLSTLSSEIAERLRLGRPHPPAPSPLR